MAEQRIKTLVIDDSGFMRILISDILRSDKQIEVISTANNGKDGVEKALAFKPNVVITDLMMPEYDGLYVVRTLMKQMPIPIILLSSLERTDQQVFDALSEGAVDFIDKPKDNAKNTEAANYLKLLVKQVGQAELPNTKLAGKNTLVHKFDNSPYDVIVIGASTGGPGAIEYILNNLPSNLDLPVVIAQHMPERFITAFAERLNASSSFEIQVADDGDLLQSGKIYLAPGTNNISIRTDVITKLPMVCVNEKRYTEYNNPSVDSLFDSIAETFGSRAIGVLLTGMGKDGAKGLKKMFTAGAFTISQDEETAVVYGMPKAAVDIGAAKKVLPLHQIPGFIVSCL